MEKATEGKMKFLKMRFLYFIFSRKLFNDKLGIEKEINLLGFNVISKEIFKRTNDGSIFSYVVGGLTNVFRKREEMLFINGSVSADAGRSGVTSGATVAVDV